MDFVLIAQEQYVSMSEVCRQFGISRKTGYKWLRRYEAEGLAGLANRSCCPHKHPLAVSGETVLSVIRLRQAHPFWGPKKLRQLLLREGVLPGSLPSESTIARILSRSGLSEPKGRGRPRRWEPDRPVAKSNGPNDVWTVDFKGWWRTGDRNRCEPLTIRDLYSRYLLCLRPMKSRKTEVIREVFQELFERYGVPSIIRSDNGSPFACITGPYGLTNLSAWWRSLGIIPDRIQPGHPEQNGAHERMHLDISREIQSNPSARWEEEVKRLERWRVEYNTERPHEALGMKKPGECYRSSKRKLSSVRPYSYPFQYQLRKVRADGQLNILGEYIFISESLRRQEIALEPLGEKHWRIWFCDLDIGSVDLLSGNRLRPPEQPGAKKR